MRYAWLRVVPSMMLIGIAALPCLGYDLTGTVDPAAPVTVFLHGATVPFENSTTSDSDGHFHFAKVPAGTYTLAVVTAARGEAVQTIEISPGLVDSKGRLDIALKLDTAKLESEGGRATVATISATYLSIPDRATKEFEEAQRCLARSDSACASTHLERAVAIAPRFTAAWNQRGTIAYQMHQYSDAEGDFRKALETDPDAFEPLVNLGGVLLNLDRPREALAYNRKAVTRRPNDALANSQLGLNYFELNDMELAEPSLKIAIKLDPAHFSHPQLTLAEIYLRRGERTKAVEQLQDFLKRHPRRLRRCAQRLRNWTTKLHSAVSPYDRTTSHRAQPPGPPPLREHPSRASPPYR
jgi:Tfp pilus assembly protein PilF